MNLPPNFQKGGGLDRTLIFRGGVGGNEGVTFSNFLRGGEGGCNFYIKDKLKSEMFNDKKNYQQKCSVITEKSNFWGFTEKSDF